MWCNAPRRKSYKIYFIPMLRLLYLLFVLCCLIRCKQVTDDYTSKLEVHRKNIDEIFSDEKKSPLTDTDRTSFHGLDYFPIDKAYAVKARIEKLDTMAYVEMQHTLHRFYPFIRWGIAHFKLHEDSCHLALYLSAEKDTKNTYLFLPFKDATNGIDTYGGGRYIDIETPQDSMATIDFNFAYNPNCAYSEQWSCPLVPNENILSIGILAGVKKFEKSH